MNLLPKDEKFFELFEKHSTMLCKASSLLMSGLADGYEGVRRIQNEMCKLEDEGDHLIHDIFARLRSTFITPLDLRIFKPLRKRSMTCWTALKM